MNIHRSLTDRRARHEQGDQGFTLVELLIVIVILGILATVTVFAVRGITDKGQTTACSTEKQTIQTATEAYFAQNSAYPANIAALVPGFLASTPTKYTYALVAGPPQSYTLTAVAPCT